MFRSRSRADGWELLKYERDQQIDLPRDDPAVRDVNVLLLDPGGGDTAQGLRGATHRRVDRVLETGVRLRGDLGDSCDRTCHLFLQEHRAVDCPSWTFLDPPASVPQAQSDRNR